MWLNMNKNTNHVPLLRKSDITALPITETENRDQNIDIDMDFLENIDIDKGILQNINIDERMQIDFLHC